MHPAGLRLALVLVLALAAAPALAAVIIIDNTDGSPTFTSTGTWLPSTSNSGFYGTNYSHNNQDASSAATYTPDLPSSGTWDVWARWTQSNNRETAVPYTVNYDGGTNTVTYDQNSGGGIWQPLGSYSFLSGTSGNVVVSAVDNSGYVVADAVAFSQGPTGDSGYIDPSTLTAYASSYISTGNRAPSQAVNGAGMEDSLGTYHVATDNGENVNWLSNGGDNAGWFEVDLGAEYVLGSVKVWNFTSTNRPDRETKTVDVYVSMASTPGSHDYATDPDWTLVMSDVEFAQIPAGLNSSPELLDFGPSGVGARWVALDILDNWGDSYTGLGELRFYPLQAVPEPASLALLLSGALLALGLAWSRRSRK